MSRPSPDRLSQNPGTALLARPLLIAIALAQLAGLVLTTMREGTPMGSWLFLIARWPEQSSIAFEQAGALAVGIGLLGAAFGRSAGVRWAGAAVSSLWFALFALFEWRMGGAPFTQVALVAHATRVATPLLLALPAGSTAAAWTARLAVALTFGTHGAEALALHPGFVDYLLAADMRLFHLGLTETTAGVVLRAIGAIDVIAALLVVSGRDLRPVLAWAAFWGFVTALSRVVQGGEGALHQALIRAANGGLPLVLLLTSRKAAMNHSLGTLRRVATRAIVPLLLLAAPLAAHAQALTGNGPGHLRLVWTEDPAHRATVSWSTTGAGAAHEVYLDTQPRGGDVSKYAIKISAQNNGAYQSGGPYYHHAEVTQLAPATRYYFVVVSDGVASPERHFITAHTDDRSFRLLFGGDSRSDPAARQKMNQLIASLAESDPGIVGLAHGGDYIEVANNWAEWNSWLEDHAQTITAGGRVLPIIPARGNHEGDGAMFNQVFGFPGGAEVDYYLTRLGEHVSFITLDTNVVIGGDQMTWLEQQLQAAQSGRWIIPSYHRPAFPAVKTPSGARQFWVPLFEQYNVDVVCESDGHVLKRTAPIRNEKIDPTGIVYVGEGGLGVPQRAPISQWYLEGGGMAKSSHHVQVFSFSPEKLVYEARSMGGGVEDRYEFQPRRTPATTTPPTEAPKPALENVATASQSQVAVTFTEDMDASTVTPAAFSISGDVQVTDVAAVSPRTFAVSTTPLSVGSDYTLTVTAVRSAAGAELASPASASFRWTGEPSVTLPPAEEWPLTEDPAEDTARGCSASGGALIWAAFGSVGAAVWRRRRSRG